MDGPQVKVKTTMADLHVALNEFVTDNRASVVPEERWLASEMEVVSHRVQSMRFERTLWGADADSFAAFRRAEIAAERGKLRAALEQLDREEKQLDRPSPPPDTVKGDG